MMGSDYCFPMAYERPVEAVSASARLAEADKQAILADNARRVLKLARVPR